MIVLVGERGERGGGELQKEKKKKMKKEKSKNNKKKYQSPIRKSERSGLTQKPVMSYARAPSLCRSSVR